VIAWSATRRSHPGRGGKDHHRSQTRPEPLRGRLEPPTVTRELLQRSLQRRPRVPLTPEPTALHPLRVTPASSVPVGPEALPVSASGRKLEYLALRNIGRTPFR
jgi:hypothetical protein